MSVYASCPSQKEDRTHEPKRQEHINIPKVQSSQMLEGKLEFK